MIKYYSLPAVAIILLLLLGAPLSFAASVTISPATGNTFTVLGNNMDEISGIDLVVKYDSSALSSPSVSQGSLASGALFAANPYFTSNTIKIGMISTSGFKGSGQIATISFAKGSGNVNIASVKMFNSSGNAVSGSTSDSTAAVITQPGIPFSQPTTSSTSRTETATTATTSAAATGNAVTTKIGTTTITIPATASATSLGSVIMSPESQPEPEAKPEEPEQPPADVPVDVDNPTVTEPDVIPEEPPVTQSAVEPSKPAGIKITTYTSVLDRFRVYDGEKNPTILMALFKKEVAPSIHQEPPVALSDGKANIRIHISLSSPNEESPNFAMNGANLISLKKEETPGRWVIEALPHANSFRAGFIILTGSEDVEFPLTIAPPVKSVTANEADFAAFLKKPADMNNDGKIDYIDEFIYTANYLARRDEPPKK